MSFSTNGSIGKSMSMSSSRTYKTEHKRRSLSHPPGLGNKFQDNMVLLEILKKDPRSPALSQQVEQFLHHILSPLPLKQLLWEYRRLESCALCTPASTRHCNKKFFTKLRIRSDTLSVNSMLLEAAYYPTTQTFLRST